MLWIFVTSHGSGCSTICKLSDMSFLFTSIIVLLTLSVSFCIWLEIGGGMSRAVNKICSSKGIL